MQYTSKKKTKKTILNQKPVYHFSLGILIYEWISVLFAISPLVSMSPQRKSSHNHRPAIKL